MENLAEINKINEIEPVKDVYGEGLFVVVRGKKSADTGYSL